MNGLRTENLCSFIHSIRLIMVLNMAAIMQRKPVTFIGTFAKLWKVTISFIMSVCPSIWPSTWNNSAPTERIFVKFGIWVFFKNLSRKFKFHWNLTRITGTLHEELCTFMISWWILLRMRNVSHKSCRETQNTHLCSTIFVWKSCLLCDNVEKHGQTKDDNIIRHMCFACWITKVTHTHTHTHTLRIYNTYCFSTATMVTRTHLNVTLYIHCLFCFNIICSVHVDYNPPYTPPKAHNLYKIINYPYT
jgi:hypothetical protein